MLHGFGNDKHEWESTNDEGDGADKYHWNNHWFATHGYYVLSYTARGFSDDGPSEDARAAHAGRPERLRSACPRGTLHLKSRDYEIRDTQWLAALVAATYPDVDPSRVAVTGGSYGGIESWLQASQATWTFPHSLDPSLPILNLQVAVPKYPSTDLAYSLAPQRPRRRPRADDLYESSQGRPDDDQGDGNPIGVAEGELRDGLFALGETKGSVRAGHLHSTRRSRAPTATARARSILESWKTRTDAGDPTSPEDPVIRQIRRGLTEFRGAYYQDEGWTKQVDGRKVAVFSIQGWTDDLFPAVESFRIFKYLKRLDPSWPVEVALADVGHSRAQNKPETWRPPQREGLPVAPVEHRRKPRAAHHRVERGDGVRRRRRSRAGGRHDAGGARERHALDRLPAAGRPCRRSAWRTRTAPPPTRSPDRGGAGRGVPAVGRARASGRRLHRLLAAAREHADLRGHRARPRAVRLGRRRPAASSPPASSTSRRTARSC